IIVETYTENLAVALILYGFMRLFGGKGSLQASIAAYCFLTAYLPIGSFLMIPPRMLIATALAQATTFPQIVQELYDRLRQLSSWERFGIFLSFFLTTAVFVLFFAGVFLAFRALHALNKPRTVLAFGLGLICSSVVVAIFLVPLFATILQGFVEHPS